MDNFTISVFELNKKIINKENFLLIDVREKDECRRCRIKGSILIPIRDIRKNITIIDSTILTIIYCHTGTRSIEVVFYLQWLGLKNVKDLEGGISNWSKYIDTNTPVYKRNPEKTLRLIKQFRNQNLTLYETKLLKNKQTPLINE